MDFILADDEPLALEMLEEAVRGASPDADIHTFGTSEPLLEFARKNHCDVAFLDIEMGETSGIALAKALKELNPSINIVFVTSYFEYMEEAFGLHASGYLLKPVTAKDVQKELEDLRRPVEYTKQCRLQVQCFGNFEVFSYGRPLAFFRSKTKELFAYLVNRRGALCTVRELAAVLWEDKPDSIATQSHLRQLVKDLTDTLAAAGASDVLYKERGRLAVLPENFTCDYYDFIRGDAGAVNTYAGEYMAQYSWAEFVAAYLNRH